MSRMKILLSKRRFHALATMAGVMVAISVVVGSGASFTAHTANPSNVFSAGTLAMTNEPNGMNVTVSNMVPGDSHTGTVTIKNTGNVQGHFYLEPVDITADTKDFAAQLQLVINDGSTEIYSSNPLADLGQLDLGTWAAGDSHTYTFTVTFPDQKGVDPITGEALDNKFMGASTTAGFKWTAESVPQGAI
jgi:spore coat-associated protein N